MIKNLLTRQKQKQTDIILAKWDASIAPALRDEPAGLEARREFLTGMLRAGAMLGSLPLWGALPACDRRSEQQRILQQHPWQTFAAVQQQLFPDDGDGPSARGIHATLYLKFVLEAPDTGADDKKFILNGVKWLNDLCGAKFGQAFIDLELTQQHTALQKIAGSRAGERWLSHLLLYILEALLTDPVYGGNPEGIGWRWLEHQPGFPRPAKDKRYVDLL